MKLKNITQILFEATSAFPQALKYQRTSIYLKHSLYLCRSLKQVQMHHKTPGTHLLDIHFQKFYKNTHPPKCLQHQSFMKLHDHFHEIIHMVFLTLLGETSFLIKPWLRMKHSGSTRSNTYQPCHFHRAFSAVIYTVNIL